jgi:twinkle protein
MADLRQFMHLQGWHWVEKQRPSGLIAVMQCPFCKNKEKSFAVSLQDGAFSCFRQNECGVKGSWFDLQRMLNISKPTHLDDNKYILRQPIVYNRPKIHSQPTDKAVEYLKSRKLTEAIIKKFKMGYKDGAIMFPYFKNGELVQVKYRSIADKKFWKEKNCESTLFNRDNCTGEALAICEGEIDCMTLTQYDIPAVSIPGGVLDLAWIENEWDYLNTFQKIYLFMDGDSAGQKAVEELVKRLGEWRCYSVILPYKDANECLMNNVESKTILEAIQNAKEFDPPTLLNAKDFQDEIIFLCEHPEKLYGIATPFERLNHYLKGWRECELTIWSGRNSSGKSTIINDVILDLIRKDHKCIIASLEMPPKRYLRWMIMNICNSPNPTRKEIESTLNWMNNNLFIVNIRGEITPDELINVFNFAARKYGVKNFFIDSLMKMTFKGVDDLKEQKSFTQDLINKVSVQHSGHVHLVAHPRKGMKDNDQPGKTDISGTGDITNLADNVLIVWRPDEIEKEKHPDIADNVVFIKKNREWGLEGHVNFSFNSDTKKFTERLI